MKKEMIEKVVAEEVFRVKWCIASSDIKFNEEELKNKVLDLLNYIDTNVITNISILQYYESRTKYFIELPVIIHLVSCTLRTTITLSYTNFR